MQLNRRLPALYPISLFLSWTLAWLIDVQLRAITDWGTSADTVYWIAMKLALWLAPLPWLIRREPERKNGTDASHGRGSFFSREPHPAIYSLEGRKKESVPVFQASALARFLDLRDPRSGILNGLWIGALLLLFSFTLDWFFGGAVFLIPVLDLSLVDALLVAPVVEELTLRGFYLGALLRRGVPFANANLAAGLVFVAMHLPGWYFQGRLRAPLSVLQPAIFLLLLGLLLGWLRQRTGSLYVCIVVHVMNNLYSAFRG